MTADGEVFVEAIKPILSELDRLERRFKWQNASPKAQTLLVGGNHTLSATVLLETDFHDSAGSSLTVSPDGKRVLVNKPVGVSVKDETPIALVTGWDRELARLVPGR